MKFRWKFSMEQLVNEDPALKENFQRNFIPLLEKNPVTVSIVLGPTGCGKSTRVAPMISEYYSPDPFSIILTQPKVTQTESIASYMSFRLGTEIGEPIGLVHSTCDALTPKTRIVVTTNGHALRYLKPTAGKRVRRPTVLIIDEVHELSTENIFLLMMAHELLRTAAATGQRFHLVLVSASLGEGEKSVHDKLLTFFSSGLWETTAPFHLKRLRRFPVRVTHSAFADTAALQAELTLTERTLNHFRRPFADLYAQEEFAGDDSAAEYGRTAPFLPIKVSPNATKILVDAVISECMDIIATSEKCVILVFLPGIGEINDVYMRLDAFVRQRACGVELFRFHTIVSPEKRAYALVPGKSRVILATDLAESSLTISDCTHVVDSGLARGMIPLSRHLMQKNSHLPLRSRLSTFWAPVHSLEQRAGRVGRTAPGIYTSVVPLSCNPLAPVDPATQKGETRLIAPTTCDPPRSADCMFCYIWKIRQYVEDFPVIASTALDETVLLFGASLSMDAFAALGKIFQDTHQYISFFCGYLAAIIRVRRCGLATGAALTFAALKAEGFFGDLHLERFRLDAGVERTAEQLMASREERDALPFLRYLAKRRRNYTKFCCDVLRYALPTLTALGAVAASVGASVNAASVILNGALMGFPVTAAMATAAVSIQIWKTKEEGCEHRRGRLVAKLRRFVGARARHAATGAILETNDTLLTAFALYLWRKRFSRPALKDFPYKSVPPTPEESAFCDKYGLSHTALLTAEIAAIRTIHRLSRLGLADEPFSDELRLLSLPSILAEGAEVPKTYAKMRSVFLQFEAEAALCERLPLPMPVLFTMASFVRLSFLFRTFLFIQQKAPTLYERDADTAIRLTVREAFDPDALEATVRQATGARAAIVRGDRDWPAQARGSSKKKPSCYLRCGPAPFETRAVLRTFRRGFMFEGNNIINAILYAREVHKATGRRVLTPRPIPSLVSPEQPAWDGSVEWLPPVEKSFCPKPNGQSLCYPAFLDGACSSISINGSAFGIKLYECFHLPTARWRDLEMLRPGAALGGRGGAALALVLSLFDSLIETLRFLEKFPFVEGDSALAHARRHEAFGELTRRQAARARELGVQPILVACCDLAELFLGEHRLHGLDGFALPHAPRAEALFPPLHLRAGAGARPEE
eukprot:gnl/Chilomastix_cuspidata/494.p1 GENE.gnl/Chilomastix_cuspidata/494~~gnl/Chilomastix_cuspidata/494.p1  ORF type:complete len:1155 (+),score=522.42 gnl/Chilomastix_cuspidata/494:2-3466(+)